MRNQTLNRLRNRFPKTGLIAETSCPDDRIAQDDEVRRAAENALGRVKDICDFV